MSEPATGALGRRWARLAAAGRVALIPYLTAGYPSRRASLEALRMLADEGADIIEVGIPFSDPLADGPTIQRASHDALQQGMTVRGVLDLVQEAALPVPVVLFSYLNPLLRYGLEAFLADAAAAGAAGLLVTDLPAGADPVVEEQVGASALDRIPLVAVTTPEPRLRQTVAVGSGFIYVISRLGVTGSTTTIGKAVEQVVARVRAHTSLPVAVGFGITGPEQAATVARFADGVVVGSALVERVGQGVPAARAFVASLRQALDTAGVPG